MKITILLVLLTILLISINTISNASKHDEESFEVKPGGTGTLIKGRRRIKLKPRVKNQIRDLQELRKKANKGKKEKVKDINDVELARILLEMQELPKEICPIFVLSKDCTFMPDPLNMEQPPFDFIPDNPVDAGMFGGSMSCAVLNWKSEVVGYSRHTCKSAGNYHFDCTKYYWESASGAYILFAGPWYLGDPVEGFTIGSDPKTSQLSVSAGSQHYGGSYGEINVQAYYKDGIDFITYGGLAGPYINESDCATTWLGLGEYVANEMEKDLE